ncbi:hypothetical protein NPIL_589661, partial [Nephila pilipes]
MHIPWRNSSTKANTFKSHFTWRNATAFIPAVAEMQNATCATMATKPVKPLPAALARAYALKRNSKPLLALQSFALFTFKCCVAAAPPAPRTALAGFGLRLQSEGFITNPLNWLVKKSLIENTAPCYICQGPSHLKENPKFTDGYSWLCQNE